MSYLKYRIKSLGHLEAFQQFIVFFQVISYWFADKEILLEQKKTVQDK